jgi:hypothetical protein
MVRLLVIDFDFFFPVHDVGEPDWWLYDWDHRESVAVGLQTCLWESRGSMFLQVHGMLPATSGAETSFWDRWTFTPETTLYVSDSNVYSLAEPVRADVEVVHLFDAHHDLGYKPHRGKLYTCENWGLWYARERIPVHVHYPAWRTQVFTAEEYCLAKRRRYPVTRAFDDPTLQLTFDRIHVCRSGAWVPPWCEDAFWGFVQRCPVATPVQYVQDMTPRVWDMDAAHAQVAIRSRLDAMEAAGLFATTPTPSAHGDDD